MTLPYLFWGIAVAAVLALLARRLRLSIKIIVLLLAICVLGFIALIDPRAIFLGNEHWYDRSPYREAILFILMLLGMAARTLSLAIEQSRRGDNIRQLNVDLWDFVYPFLVAFITFGAVMAQVGSSALSLTGLIFAFQNGFFWQTLMKSRGSTSP